VVTGQQTFVQTIIPYSDENGIAMVQMICNDGSEVWTSAECGLEKNGNDSISCTSGFHSVSTYDYGNGVSNIRGNCVGTGACADSDPTKPTEGGGWTDIDTHYLTNATSNNSNIVASAGIDGSEVIVGVSLVPSCGHILLVKERLRVQASGAWVKILSVGQFPPAQFTVRHGATKTNGLVTSEAFTASASDSISAGFNSFVVLEDTVTASAKDQSSSLFESAVMDTTSDGELQVVIH